MSNTVAYYLQQSVRALLPVAASNAALEARLLARHAWGFTPEELLKYHDAPITQEQAERLRALVDRRLTHEPVSHILGYRDFWRERFKVTADVLTPRPDSEALIEAVLTHYPDRSAPLRILDLGTGSGCLLLSLLHEYPHAQGTGVDISTAALAVAQHNAQALQQESRAQFFCGSWCKPLDKADRFAIIISNPPYIAHAAMAGLMPDVVGFEPHLALHGGDDGLACYREIFSQIRPHMEADAKVVVEIGESQTNDVTAIADAQGFARVAVRHDLGGNPRALVFECK